MKGFETQEWYGRNRSGPDSGINGLTRLSTRQGGHHRSTTRSVAVKMAAKSPNHAPAVLKTRFGLLPSIECREYPRGLQRRQADFRGVIGIGECFGDLH